MSDHTDRVELTDAEIWSVLNATGIWYSTTPGIHKRVTAAVESIVAARVHAENQRLLTIMDKEMGKLQTACGQRDAARAELAAANARCAELEKGWKVRADAVIEYRTENAALQATKDRVTALADEWKRLRKDDLSTPVQKPTADAVRWCELELRAALTDTRESKCKCGHEKVAHLTYLYRCFDCDCTRFAALADSGTKDGSNDE